MSDFDLDAYLSQGDQGPQQSFDLDKYLSQPSTPSSPSDVPKTAASVGPQRFTPAQLMDPRNVAAIDAAYGFHRPVAEAIANVGNAISAFPQKAGNAVQNYSIAHNASPYTAAALGEGTELGVNVVEGLPFGGIRGASVSTATPTYAAEEAAEATRLGDIHARAAAKGFQIPDAASPDGLAKAAANNQPLADNVVRANFGLSDKADLTPQMMESWRGKFNSGNTYAEARNVPRVQLNDDAVESLGGLPKPLYDRLGLDKKIAPDNTVSGDDAVDISQALRARSSQLWKTSKMFPEYEDQAVSIDKSVDNLEDSVAPNLKDPQQWNLDRAKNAQSYNVQAALDSGHVDVGDLARMKFAKGQIKPWTGDISDLADLGQLHPDSFRLTRIQPQSYGMLRKGLAWGAGAAASYAAGKAGLGAVSHIIGQQTSNSVTPQ